ncbi:MAG: hypothetical protein ACREIW_05135 [Chthoniobacterales bacterium]
MKKFAVAMFLGAFGLLLRAQDAAPPQVDLKVPEVPAATPLPSPDVPDISKIDEIFKQTSLGKQADEQRLHIQWRQLANEVANDPEVIAAKAATHGLRTDLEKRQRLRAYYKVYYERMKAKATSDDIRLAIEQLKASHVSMTAQPRVRPETDGTAATPPPAPPKQKRHQKRGLNQ